MEKFVQKIGQVELTPQSVNLEKEIENFYSKFLEKQTESIIKITLQNLKELKEKGITTEQFLDHLCKSHDFLLHGSIYEIEDDGLKSQQRRIFATNKSAIAIMRSMYSNINVNLEYSYVIDENNPLELIIHTPPDGTFISVDKGFVYIVDSAGFKNDPEGSWQYVKEDGSVGIHIVVETEKNDFKYPVTAIADYEIPDDGFEYPTTDS